MEKFETTNHWVNGSAIPLVEAWKFFGAITSRRLVAADNQLKFDETHLDMRIEAFIYFELSTFAEIKYWALVTLIVRQNNAAAFKETGNR